MEALRVVEVWKDAVSRGDMDAFGALYAPDALLFVPLSPEPIKGRQAIQQYEGGFHCAFPAGTLSVLRSLSGGDRIAVEWEYSGTNTGPLATAAGVLPPTNQRMSVRGASFFRVDLPGLIAEECRYYDTRSLFQQLGIS